MAVNTQLLERIAKWLENGAVEVDRFGNPIKFDMRLGVYSGADSGCGTACCIAGAAVQFGSPEFIEDYFKDVWYEEEQPWSDVMSAAIDVTGLDEETASKLFEPQYYFDRSPALAGYSNPELAAKVIRNFLAGGVVDWDVDINLDMKDNA